MSALMELRETAAVTDDTRLAACLRVFQAQLIRKHPFEWDSPPTRAVFNFDARTLPEHEIVTAFELPISDLDGELELLLWELEFVERDKIKTAIKRILMRACHEVLLRREELVRWVKNDKHRNSCDEHYSKV